MEDHPFPQIGDRATWRTAKSTTSGQLTAREIENYCVPDGKGATLLKQAISRLGLSARGHHRILKVARTIADLTAVDRVSAAQVAEAIQYRRFDRSQHQKVKP
jgi:magnesium chelatase family protein